MTDQLVIGEHVGLLSNHMCLSGRGSPGSKLTAACSLLLLVLQLARFPFSHYVWYGVWWKEQHFSFALTIFYFHPHKHWLLLGLPKPVWYDHIALERFEINMIKWGVILLSLTLSRCLQIASCQTHEGKEILLCTWNLLLVLIDIIWPIYCSYYYMKSSGLNLPVIVVANMVCNYILVE